MPKEQINTPKRRVVTEYTSKNGLKPGEWALGWAQDGEGLHDGQHFEETPVLHVCWDAAGQHRIDDDPQHGAMMQFVVEVDADEVLRAADAIRRTRDDPALAGYPSWEFPTIRLTRYEAQKAIKTVRRARDAVYGSDE